MITRKKIPFIGESVRKIIQGTSLLTCAEKTILCLSLQLLYRIVKAGPRAPAKP